MRDGGPTSLEELIKECNVQNKTMDKNWKLIEYQCHTDEEFEFYNMMKLK